MLERRSFWVCRQRSKAILESFGDIPNMHNSAILFFVGQRSTRALRERVERHSQCARGLWVRVDTRRLEDVRKGRASETGQLHGSRGRCPRAREVRATCRNSDATVSFLSSAFFTRHRRRFLTASPFPPVVSCPERSTTAHGAATKTAPARSSQRSCARTSRSRHAASCAAAPGWRSCCRAFSSRCCACRKRWWRIRATTTSSRNRTSWRRAGTTWSARAGTSSSLHPTRRMRRRSRRRHTRTSSATPRVRNGRTRRRTRRGFCISAWRAAKTSRRWRRGTQRR